MRRLESYEVAAYRRLGYATIGSLLTTIVGFVAIPALGALLGVVAMCAALMGMVVAIAMAEERAPATRRDRAQKAASERADQLEGKPTEELFALSRSAEEVERAAAADALGGRWLREEEKDSLERCFRRLLELAKDESPIVAAAAIQSLAFGGENIPPADVKAGVDMFFQRAEVPDAWEDLMVEAALALSFWAALAAPGEQKGWARRAADLLKRAPPLARFSLAHMLGRMSDATEVEAAYATARDLVGDRDRLVRDAAVHAIGALGPRLAPRKREEALALLNKLEESSKGRIRGAAIAALVVFAVGSESPLQEVIVRRAIVYVTSGDPDVSTRARDALYYAKEKLREPARTAVEGALGDYKPESEE